MGLGGLGVMPCIKGVLGAAHLQRNGLRGQAAVVRSSKFSSEKSHIQVVIGQFLIFVGYKLNIFKTTEGPGQAPPGLGSVPGRLPGRRAAVTFPPDDQGQLPRVGLPAGFDEHHHLVVGVF